MPPLQPPPLHLPILSNGRTPEAWQQFFLKLFSQASINGALEIVGGFGVAFTFTAPTAVTFPASGTLLTTTSGVASLHGTALQIAVSAATGAVTVSLIGPHGFTTLAANGVLYGNGNSAILALAVNATATRKFLEQHSSNAPAWSTLTAADLSVASINTTGLTANVAAATFYAVPAGGEGLYRVTAYVVETTAGSVSSVLPNVQIIYTDKDSNVSVTIDATPILGAAGLGQTGALNANAGGTVSTGIIAIYVKASTTIQYQTSNYASVAAGMTYALRLRLELL